MALSTNNKINAYCFRRVMTIPRHHSGISKKLSSAMWNELVSHMLMQLRNTKWKLFKFASYGHGTYI